MFIAKTPFLASLVIAILFFGLEAHALATETAPLAAASPQGFDGSSAGEEREVAGVKLCWCPAGTFLMGSPRDEPERRPDEAQVKVTLSHGFWMAKLETTQGDW